MLNFIISLMVNIVCVVAGWYLGRERSQERTLLYFDELKDTQFGFYKEKYTIYKIVNGYAIEMEDAKNAVQAHSRLEELSRGENTNLDFKYNFNTDQYELQKDYSPIDSTDEFY